MRIFNNNKERSYWCHNSNCDHHFRSVSKTNHENYERNICKNKYFELIDHQYQSKDQASRTSNEQCEYRPKFLPFGSLSFDKRGQRAKMLDSARPTVVGGLQNSGICTKCSLYFPVTTGKHTTRIRFIMHQARYSRAVKLTDRKCVKTTLELIVPEL